MPKGTRKRPSVLGKNLRRLRQRVEMTQRALGERSGVHFVSIARLESGEQQSADTPTIERLARALGVRQAELIEAENGGGWIASVEPVIKEYLDSTLAQTQEPSEEELSWLRSLPGAFWFGAPPSAESIALLVQSYRKRRK